MGSKAAVTRKAQVKTGKQSVHVTARKHGRQADAPKNNRKGVEVARSTDDVDIWELLRRRKKAFQVKVEGDKLTITLARFDPPTRSISGKSFVVATTGGVKRSSLLVDGSHVYVVATAFYYDDGGEPPVRWQPLFELPKQEDEQDDDQEEDEIEELA
jgi:hypothetical protein